MVIDWAIAKNYRAHPLPIVATNRHGRFVGLLTRGNLIDVPLLADANAPAEGHRTGSR